MGRLHEHGQAEALQDARAEAPPGGGGVLDADSPTKSTWGTPTARIRSLKRTLSRLTAEAATPEPT